MVNTIQIEGMTAEQLQRMFDSANLKLDSLLNLFKHLASTDKAKETKKYLTTKEACDMLHVTSMTLRRWAKAGILHPKRAGNRIYYLLSDVESALQDKAV